MPTGHQLNAGGAVVGGSHDRHCATIVATCPNRAIFALTVSKSPRWTVWENQNHEHPYRACRPTRVGPPARTRVRHLHPRPVLRDAVRILRLQHLHSRRTGWCRTPTAGWPRCASNCGWRRPQRRFRAACSTVFVGGGTPSLLGGAGLAAVLGAVRDNFDLAVGAEVTTEANPESTSPEMFATLREAGYTRVSLGMQSAAPQVLAVLDRTHSPGARAGGGSWRPGTRGSNTSTSISSTARRGRPTTICGARSTSRWVPVSTTCPRIR